MARPAAIEDSVIIDSYNNGMSMNEIHKQYHTSREHIANVLRKNGIEKRNTAGVVNDNLFAFINSSSSAYWLGMLYADGNIRKNKNEVSLALKDRDCVENFHKFCDNKNAVAHRQIMMEKSCCDIYTSSFSNKQVKDNLIALGCVPAKSFVLTFPSEQQVPKQYIYDFIRGYIDGDGYIQWDTTKSRYRICILGTKKFLQGLIKELEAEHIARIYQEKGEKIYRCEVSQKEATRNILIKLYRDAEVYLQRKYNIAQNSFGSSI